MKQTFIPFIIGLVIIGGIIFFFNNSLISKNKYEKNKNIDKIDNIYKPEQISTPPLNYKNIQQIKENIPIQDIEISYFSTKIYTKTFSRMKNLKLASKKIDGLVISPGETFSFNKTVGQRTEKEGYKKADIFDYFGNKYKATGGGICQISSTIFNAIDQIGMQTIERHEHSGKVYYVPEHRDATVMWGNLDYKFKNNKNFPIKITVEITKNEVIVRIYEVKNK